MKASRRALCIACRGASKDSRVRKDALMEKGKLGAGAAPQDRSKCRVRTNHLSRTLIPLGEDRSLKEGEGHRPQVTRKRK